MRYLFEKNTLSPKGSNKGTSSESYDDAVYYDVVFPQGSGQAKPIVTRATIRGLYGKVDTYGFAVVPKQEQISVIVTDNDETHEALRIVKECFEEMAAYYKELSLRGKLSLNSKTLNEIMPKKSWKNPMISYASHQREIINNFISTKGTDSPEVVDYKTFENFFMKYAYSMDKPFTMSGFCTSKHSDPRHSGLVIDISPESYSEDSVKYEGYIKDPNFQVFRKVVNRYGFRIDKNIPWRLYFDISHSYSKRKLARYGVGSTSEFFTKYYDRVANLEVDNIDSTLSIAYNAYYDADPTYIVAKYCNKSGETKINTKVRENVTLEKLRLKYNSGHWIRAYIYFRAVESGKKWNQAKFDKVVSEAVSIDKYRGSNAMVLLTEPYFIDKTSELFQKRDLTNRNSFDRIITDFKF